MIQHQYTRRVQYADTDRMNFVYYGRYAEYLEAARVELIRYLGISYKEIEDRGIFMPVLEYNIRFRKPATYDDTLILHSEIREIPSTRLPIHSRIFSEKGELVAEAVVVLVFLEKERNRPVKAPDFFLTLIHQKWGTRL